MSSIVDPHSLASLREAQQDGAPDIVGETVAIFLADSGLRLDLIRRAVAEADAETLHCVARAFRGGALLLGAVRLAEACEVLERIGAERRVEDAAAASERIVFEFALAQQALRQVARSSPS